MTKDEANQRYYAAADELRAAISRGADNDSLAYYIVGVSNALDKWNEIAEKEERISDQNPIL